MKVKHLRPLDQGSGNPTNDNHLSPDGGTLAEKMDLFYNGPMDENDLKRLKEAKALLENPGLAVKLTNALGAPIEKAMDALPTEFRGSLQEATHKAIRQCLEVAVNTLDRYDRETPTADWAHRMLAGASGAIGGFFGLAALALELPLSTTIMLRSIADHARAEGEDLSSVDGQMACMEVFALGGRSKGDDAAESGYFAIRALLAREVSSAAAYIAERGLAGEGGPAIVRWISSVASRFGVAVSEKAAAQAVPVIGAAGGAGVNLLFMQHFQDMAKGHFTVRALERKYGAEVVKQAYLAA